MGSVLVDKQVAHAYGLSTSLMEGWLGGDYAWDNLLFPLSIQPLVGIPPLQWFFMSIIHIVLWNVDCQKCKSLLRRNLMRVA